MPKYELKQIKYETNESMYKISVQNLAFSPNILQERSLIESISVFLNFFLVFIRRYAVKQFTASSHKRPRAAPMYPTSLKPAGITINAIPM